MTLLIILLKELMLTEGFINDKNWQLNKVYIISTNKKNNTRKLFK